MAALQFPVICFLAILGFASSRRPFDVFFDELKCSHYGDPVKEASCSAFQKSNITYVKGRLELTSPINIFNIHAVIEIPRAGGESMKFFDMTLDGCKLLDGGEGENLILLAVRILRKNGNIPKKCPIPANELFHLDDMELDPNFLPNYTPEFAFVTNIDMVTNKKVVYKIFIKGRIEMKNKRKLMFKTN